MNNLDYFASIQLDRRWKDNFNIKIEVIWSLKIIESLIRSLNKANKLFLMLTLGRKQK